MHTPTDTSRKETNMSYDQFGNQFGNQYGNFLPQYQQRQPQNIYAFVSGIEGARAYNVPINQSILLMDNAQPVCYLKQANALGQTSLKCFKLVEVSENDLSIPTKPAIEYATKDDIKALNERIDAIIPKEK